MRRFFSRSSIYRGNRPWPWALPLWLNYITSPRSRQGRGLVVFSLTIYIFRQRWYNGPMSKGGQTVIPTILARGGGQYDIDRSTYASQFVVLGCLWNFNVPKEITAT